MKKLSELIDCSYDVDILGIADDSRNIKTGYLFVATKGYYVDHFDYIDDAIKNGAVAVVTDRTVNCGLPVIVVDNINQLYSQLCSKFYDVNINDFNFVGITGTDGKTTTATVVNEILCGIKKSAYIGTNGVKIGNVHFNTNNTTPCISELYDDLSKIKQHKCKDVVMEVSSEALLHDRLNSFKYKIVAFTNITEDHLNVHKTIENYRNCKFKLLDLLDDDGFVVINGDDDNCRMIDANNLYSVGTKNDNYCVISNVKEMSNCVKFNLKIGESTYYISSPLLGFYNVYNVSMAFVICMLLGVDINYLIDAISKLSVVSGRREYLNFGQNYDIILDYAHTYNGIKCLLESVSNYKNIIVVTGAAGGREKEKRSKIGKLILDNADIAIFTMDDPRYESVDEIIDQMTLNTTKEYIRIIDREEAIYKALSLANCDSVVLVIGKGRDNYMAIDDKKIPYCDYDVIEKYFSK